MENLNGLSVEELQALAVEVKSAISEKRAENKANAKSEKEERANQFRSEIGAGDRVSFLYGRDNDLFEGIVVRVSEKSVTVESEAFAKGKNYVRFDRFVEVLEKAEVEAEVDEDLEEAI